MVTEVQTQGFYRPHKRVQLVCKDESRTQQHMADECDINLIVKRFEKTGILEHVNEHKGSYGDVADAPSYQEGMNLIIRADAMFMSLPAVVRAKFDNDPATFLAFADDPENHDEMVSMGLRKETPPVVEKAVEGAVAPEAEPAGKPEVAAEAAP